MLLKERIELSRHVLPPRSDQNIFISLLNRLNSLQLFGRNLFTAFK